MGETAMLDKAMPSIVSGITDKTEQISFDVILIKLPSIADRGKQFQSPHLQASRKNGRQSPKQQK